MYRDGLSDIVHTPQDLSHEEPVYHNFVIRVDQNIRDNLMSFLLEKGIETKIHYPIPIHLQECAKNLNYRNGDFPLSEKYALEMISLPIYPELSNKEVEIVIKSVKEFF
jgi:dTDP-4-amino-4,6-dideoxygalactose transaminase